MIGVDFGAQFLLDISLALLLGSTLTWYVFSELRQDFSGNEVGHQSSCSHSPVALKVPRILMHWDVNDATQDCKDSILLLQALFEFDVFVPERMCEEVKSNTVCSAFK
jgi:hypothetical protein